ncbi:KAT8 regulatory NSL complex subunit 1 [Schistocerca americana]|uniref:KAT8 regulatory NSL complex subunit 1 n=1 Tax=Schistocerca americana TaxID=7009 RepID=UPI001F4F72BE|nr:KAT8 regulatory NSL complex subunit 1 [Schistocerca americana]
MGVRFASLRHSDVVMAPALTEAGQSQNFKLPSAHTSPSSPIGVSYNGHKHVSASPFLSDDDVYKIATSNKTTKNKKFPNCANGFRSGFLKYSADAGSLAYDNLKTLAIASELLNKRTDLSEGILKVSEGGSGGIEHLRMNYSDPSMGDNKGKMGLQKSSTAIRSLESGRLNRVESDVNKVDNQIKIFNPTVTRNSKKNETVNCTSLTKRNSLPPTTSVSRSSGAMVNSRRKTSTEVLGSNNDNAKASFETPRGADETFEHEFFSNVMELCVDDTKGFTSDDRAGVTKETIEALRKKQHEVERRCDFLARRIRMFQAKIMVSCAERQVNNFIAYSYENMKQNSHKDLGSGECSSAAVTPSECDSACASVASNDRQSASLKAASTFYKSYDINQVSTSTSRQGSRKCSGISAECTTTTTSATAVSGPQLRLSPDVVKELDSVSGQLHTQLKFVQNELDSDVTASSSGGESCDEFLTNEDSNQHTLPIEKRAAWRWAQHRARIASRWTWLQAQISDLEYRIRQHNDIHRQIRLTKDPMVLADVPFCAAGGAGPPLVVNGYHGGGSGAGAGAGAGSASLASQGKSEEQCCARVRPLARQPQLPKRKLLHVQGLHAASKRASRPATVRCACRPPATVCALCTGRPDPTQPRPLHAHLPAAERAAALDPAFHPVLSMPQDVKESIYYEGIMKTTEWQQKTLRSSLKSMRAAGLPKFDRDTVVERRNKKHQVEPRRKYTSRLKKTMTNTLTAKIKKKLTKSRKQKNTDNNNHTLQRIKRRRRDGPKSGNSSYHGYEDGDDDVPDSGASVSKHASPVPSPGPASCSLERLTSQGSCKVSGESSRRKRENSYDIDNIVIPYSIASAARLEKLQYKEIPTPKWRLIENNFVGRSRLSLRNNGVIRRSSHESDVEDISDETIALRHDRCEMEEKKKFMSYIKLPYSGRSRAARRTDSRAESSGANTPDPMSPNPSEYQDGISPVMSPLPPSSDPDQYCGSGTRRRTVSSSRWHRDEMRSSTPDGVTEVPPYEPRKFPLSDDMYEKMLKCMPEGHPYPPPSQEPKKLLAKDIEFGESRPVSPSTDSTESAIGEGEDPNDPEWTVEEEREFERDRVKSSVKR